MKTGRKAGRIAAVVVGIVAVGAVLHIMLHGIGLNPELDFGAGAYYYTDIPEDAPCMDWECYAARLPFWVYCLLFLLWGALMYRLWVWMEKKHV
ncbi:MAG: hypothetical protein J5871_04705 [Bacteroidales bacterium]|nr:hypothetical protein [Bacteroidales bacterium]